MELHKNRGGVTASHVQLHPAEEEEEEEEEDYLALSGKSGRLFRIGLDQIIRFDIGLEYHSECPPQLNHTEMLIALNKKYN